MGPLLNGVENLVTKDPEQAEVLGVFFASVFTDNWTVQVVAVVPFQWVGNFFLFL